MISYDILIENSSWKLMISFYFQKKDWIWFWVYPVHEAHAGPVICNNNSQKFCDFFSAKQLLNIIMDIYSISMQWQSAKKYKLGVI